MVKITIYIEGGVPNSEESFLDNSVVFRENFHQLFVQKLPQNSFDLAIQSIGQISQAAKHLEKINAQNINGVLLIDLDGPKSIKAERLRNNYSSEPSKVFFMIQEMEGWIISQPEKIEEYARTNAFIFKRTEPVRNNSLIFGIHPEEIVKPGNRLDTIFRQHFAQEKRHKTKPKNYVKSKDGPALIGLLDLDNLFEVFDEVQNLINHIQAI